ncbi:hypothetical protein LINGRAHAP2_LOCUS29570 [Linum grandiflorum]
MKSCQLSAFCVVK